MDKIPQVERGQPEASELSTTASSAELDNVAADLHSFAAVFKALSDCDKAGMPFLKLNECIDVLIEDSERTDLDDPDFQHYKALLNRCNDFFFKLKSPAKR